MNKNKNNVCRIYSLSDPDSGDIKYIGCTSKELEDRLQGHMSQRGSNLQREKNLWVSLLVCKGKRPVIKLIEAVDSECGLEREKYWIELHVDQGCKLFNLQHNVKFHDHHGKERRMRDLREYISTHPYIFKNISREEGT